ncbi:MAG: hypothetical protein JNL82_31720 [Myxococcales bacterium]|nr:hypothetical protein [Myxococcales bacterium]
MRDTSSLRQRILTALALPLAAGLACGGGPTPTPGEAPRAAPAPAAKADPLPLRPPIPDPPPWTSPYPARTGQDPLDPDGVEEEGCPNGDWCGSPAAAEKFRARIATDDPIGCPTRLQGSAQPAAKPDDRAYKGLSFNPMMQGRLRKIATAEQRQATGNDALCCYHWFDYCSGRPLLDDGLASVRAPLQAGDAWLPGHVPEASDELAPGTRRTLAALWRADARDEHASVAAFARATLELLAVGAPPGLVAASQQASLDEIRHAQVCLGLAARLDGEAAEFGPLPALAPRGGGLVALACATFLEGCVGETIAALAAGRAARGASEPAVREALAAVADDEARHAELAWATVAWAVRTGGRAVAEAVRALADELRAGHDEAHAPADALAEATLVAHGRLPARALAEARRDAWDDILAPTLALVLA